MEKKKVSKTKFIFSIIISFLVWNLVTWFLGNVALGLFNRINNNLIKVIGSYVIWILKSLMIITMVYLNNRKKRVAKYELNKVKIISLVIFYVLTIGISISDIIESIMLLPLVSIVATIIHMFLIALINDIMFRRCISNEEK